MHHEVEYTTRRVLRAKRVKSTGGGEKAEEAGDENRHEITVAEEHEECEEHDPTLPRTAVTAAMLEDFRRGEFGALTEELWQIEEELERARLVQEQQRAAQHQ